MADSQEPITLRIKEGEKGETSIYPLRPQQKKREQDAREHHPTLTVDP
jgi:hypothetical protein